MNDTNQMNTQNTPPAPPQPPSPVGQPQQQPVYYYSQPPYYPPPPPSKPGAGRGTAALVCGIVSLAIGVLFSFLLWQAALILGVVAIVLGIIGIVKKQESGALIAGLGCGIFGFLCGFAWMFVSLICRLLFAIGGMLV